MRFLVLFAALLALLLVGCGGGGGHHNPANPTLTGATLVIDWPARTRLGLDVTLTSARSATIVLAGAAVDGADVTLNVVRSAEAAAHAETYTVPVPIRKSVASLAATFFAGEAQLGPVVGTAAAAIHLEGTSLQIAALHVIGKINFVAVVPPAPIPATGPDVQLQAEAQDIGDAILAISAGSLRWEIVGTTDAFTLTPDGVLNPIKGGTGTVRATVDGVPSDPFTITVAGPTATTLNVESNRLVYSPANGKIWVTVSANAASNPNSVVAIDPANGAVGTVIPLNAEGNLIAVSTNGQVGWVTLDAGHSVRRLDLVNGTVVATYNVPGGDAFTDLKAVPGQPGSFAVATDPVFGVNVGVFDDGVRRANTGAGGYALHFASATLLHGDGHGDMFTDVLTPTAINWTAQDHLDISGGALSLAEGLFYNRNGQIVDPVSKTFVGALATTHFLIDRGPAVGETEDRVYYVTWDSGLGKRILTYDRTTKTELALFDTGILEGGALDLAACGGHTVAFHLFGIGVARRVVIVRGLP